MNATVDSSTVRIHLRTYVNMICGIVKQSALFRYGRHISPIHYNPKLLLISINFLSSPSLAMICIPIGRSSLEVPKGITSDGR